ncbi:hypothetical protein AB4Z54_62645, partial [Streptomyces sp. MCAF7]
CSTAVTDVAALGARWPAIASALTPWAYTSPSRIAATHSRRRGPADERAHRMAVCDQAVTML